MSSLLKEPPVQPASAREPEPASPSPLRLVTELIGSLNAHGIRYCHWKSNHFLAAALAGVGDLDLLVDRRDGDRFLAILARLGFKQAVDRLKPPMPSVCHFYALDATGSLVHLHVYYRLLTGESLLKNYRLPLEELLLEHTRKVGDVPVPIPAAELILFVVRTLLKHCSLIEGLLLARAGGYSREELEGLLAGDTAARAEKLLAEWLPAIDLELFRAGVEALRRGSRWQRFRVAKRLQRRLATYRRSNAVRELRTRVGTLVRAVWRRLLRRRGGKELTSGGAVIAIVGPDATGKSTLVADTRQWLGKAFAVRHGHLGRAPSAWLTLPFNLAGRALRALMRRGKADEAETLRVTPENPGLVYCLRAVCLAWDRRALAARLHRLAANGAIVVCDRYPSPTPGAMDGARLGATDPARVGRLRAWLARLERRLYQEVPAPDVLVKLTVPVEVALERNRLRQGQGKEAEPDAYIVRRHASVVLPSFPNARTVEIDTGGSRDDTTRQLRSALWDLL